MERLIKSQNFAHNNKRINNTFRREVTSLTNNDTNIKTRGVQVVFLSLDALCDKLTIESSPKYGTEGWQMAQFTFAKIVSIACTFRRESSSEEIEKRLYLCIVRLLDHSMTLLHLNMAYQCLQDNGLQVKTYLKELKKESAGNILSAVCKPIKSEETKSGDEYAQTYYKFMEELLATVTESQVKDNYNSLLEYAVYCFLDATSLEEEVYVKMKDIGRRILTFVDNPFASCDIERIKHYIRKCSTLFRFGIFPLHQQVSQGSVEFTRIMMLNLGKLGQLELLYSEVFELLIAAAKCTYTSEGDNYALDLFNAAHGFFQSFKTKKRSVNVEAFENIVQRFIDVIDEMEVQFLNSDGFTFSVVNALFDLYRKEKLFSQTWLKLIVPLLKKPCKSTMEACTMILKTIRKIHWEEHTDIIDTLIDILQSLQPPDSVEDLDGTEFEKYIDFLNSVTDTIFDSFGRFTLGKSYGNVLMNLSMKFIKINHEVFHRLAVKIARMMVLDEKGDKAAFMEVMKMLDGVLKDDNLPLSSADTLNSAVIALIEAGSKSFKDGQVFSDEDFGVFVSICQTCLKEDSLDSQFRMLPSGHFLVFFNVVGYLLDWLVDLNKMELASLVPEILKKTSEKESTISATMKTQLMYFVNSPSGRKAASLFLNEMIELFLETEDRQILTVLTSVYPSNPKAFEDHFRFCVEKMIKSRDVNLVNSLAYLLKEVSKKQLFTSEDIQMLFEKAQRNTNWQLCVLLILQELAKRCPEKMIDHISFLLDRSAWPSHVAVYFITDIMKTLALFQKDVASSIVGAIFLYLKSTQEKQEQLPLFSALDAICFKYPGLLNRQDVEAISPTDPDVVRQKHKLLNIIDGKTPDDLAEKLKKHEEDLDELVGRVDETEEFVNEVKEEVTQQSEQLGQVKHDVKEQGKKLSTVKLDEPDIKVEGFDPMTLVQSPFSTRDLTQFLNTNQKLQSSQLGYNNEAFRGLAHAGMASLDRWDTTRQTSEAALNASTLHLEMDMPDVNAMMDYAMRNAATAYSKWLSPSCEEFTLNKRETQSHGFQTDLFIKDESVP